jgi:endonuclease/exonuclease/phosphatase family metal-dependent hydrolase
MAKKKSRLRVFIKKFLLVLNILVTVLFLYPIFFHPLPFIWINGFLGIAAPYLILLELLLIILWLLAKPIFALLPLLSLAIGWKVISVLFAWHPGTPFYSKRKNNQLRIASWNIKEFNGSEEMAAGHKFRAEEIAYSIQKWDPDIICLQEYNTKERPNDAANHAIYFEKNYPYSFFSKDYQTADPNYYAGCIIYSKYPIIDSKRKAFLNGESVIYATVLKGDDTIRVYTTHLASYRFKQNDFEFHETPTNDLEVKANRGVAKKMKQAFIERAVQADIVKGELDQSPYPTILTGDFNDVPSSYTYTTIKGNLQDAFLKKGFGIGLTFMGLSPTLRIDYILADDRWDIKAWESVDENLSDHHMILSDLLLKKN